MVNPYVTISLIGQKLDYRVVIRRYTISEIIKTRLPPSVRLTLGIRSDNVPGVHNGRKPDAAMPRV